MTTRLIGFSVERTFFIIQIIKSDSNQTRVVADAYYCSKNYG